MDPGPVIQFSEFLSAGSVGGVFAMFSVIIIGLVWDRIRIVKKNDQNQITLLENKEKELESIKQIIDKYHEGNLNLSRTLSEIKIVLENIQRH